MRLTFCFSRSCREYCDEPANASAPLLPEGMTMEQWEDEMIREALRRANGNKSQAARLLGLSRNALRYRLEKIGIPDEPAKDPQPDSS